MIILPPPIGIPFIPFAAIEEDDATQPRRAFPTWLVLAAAAMLLVYLMREDSRA